VGVEKYHLGVIFAIVTSVGSLQTPLTAADEIITLACFKFCESYISENEQE